MVDSTRQAVTGAERRLAPRAEICTNAAYEDVDRQVFIRSRDISELGMFLLTPEPPPIGLTGKITLELPGDPAILRFRGTVVRRSSVEPRGFALQFDPQAVDERLRDRVRGLVESALGDRQSI